MTPVGSATRTKLSKYRAKRDFAKTAEPSGNGNKDAVGHSYLIQKHAASRLHYDLRLELDGVLKSWAVTRGPSLNPADRRLAVHVEDHPLDYGSFEGTIPQGQYGGGTVMLWDRGTWTAMGDPNRGLARGNLTFTLSGKRLRGRWHLVRLRDKRSRNTKRDNWLLIKGKDEYADANGDAALDKYQTSVVSRRTLQGIAKAAGQSLDRTCVREHPTRQRPKRRRAHAIADSGRLRHPSFQGLREDKPAREVVREREKSS